MFALSTLAVKHGVGCMRLLWVAEHVQGQVGEPAPNLVFCVFFLHFCEKNIQLLCWFNLLVATRPVKPAGVVQQRPHDMRKDNRLVDPPLKKGAVEEEAAPSGHTW